MLLLVAIQADLRHPVYDANGSGHGVPGAYRSFGLMGHRKVLRAREAVGDQGRLQRHDRGASLQGFCYVVPDLYAAGSTQRGSLFDGLLTKRLTG